MNTTEQIDEYIKQIASSDLRACCRTLTREDKFFAWPASLSFHHHYEGGLATHTLEVIDCALIASDGVMGVDRDVLIAASLWHDAAKILEYEIIQVLPSGEPPEGCLRRGVNDDRIEYWQKASFYKQVGHISGSMAMFYAAARQQGNVPQETVDAVCHAVLAHHGRREWGSPVEPQTVEALLLHQADMLSAKYGDTRNTP